MLFTERDILEAMNRFCSSILTVLVICSLFFAAEHAQAAGFVFTRTLTVGLFGTDVVELQKILNTSPDTRVADVGPGSPGQETAYYGVRTANAVARFQQKYSMDILVPNGLSVGTGVVGASTRAVLAKLEAAPLQTAVATPPPSLQMPLSSSISNPNLANIDTFLTNIDKVGVKKGFSASSLAQIKSQVLKDAATTTDLRKKFLSIAVKSPQHSEAKPSTTLGILLSYIERSFDRIFRPEKALAQSQGSTPFGGQLEYAYFCTCSDTWLLTMEPLPPSYAVLLTYVPFTQGYLSYNIPYAGELLGMYQEGSGECLIYYGYGCATIPSEGMITPEVGSNVY